MERIYFILFFASYLLLIVDWQQEKLSQTLLLYKLLLFLALN